MLQILQLKDTPLKFIRLRLMRLKVGGLTFIFTHSDESEQALYLHKAKSMNGEVLTEGNNVGKAFFVYDNLLVFSVL